MLGDNESRLEHAAEARAFNWGLSQVELERFTHIAKLDGDIELAAGYFARLLEEFALDAAPRHRRGDLRGAGPARMAAGSHAPAPRAWGLKVYSRRLLRSHRRDPRAPGLGHDRRDLRAHAGLRHASVPELVARHRRAWGSVGGRLRGCARYGVCAYAARYPPPWVALRSLKVAVLPPAGLSGIAFLYGYAKAAVNRAPRMEDDSFRRFVRAELHGRIRRKFSPSTRVPPREAVGQKALPDRT